MRLRRIYISGPMTSYPHFNFPAFNEAARFWRGLGWDVENPADHFGGRTDLPRRVYLQRDFREILDCDAIAMLPGWESADGARRELAVAQGIELEVFDAVTGLPEPFTVSLYGHVPLVAQAQGAVTS